MIARAVFSLWSRPPGWRLERGPLLIHTLAVCLAAQWFPSVNFVTDTRGAQIAAALGWEFSSTRLDLEDLAPDLAHVWALGKLAAIGLQNEPCIHIDGDVLLGAALPRELLGADLLAQSPDDPSHYATEKMKHGKSVLGMPPETGSYNCGLLGGGASILDFAAWAVARADRFRGSEVDGTAASMLIEQSGLGLYASYHGLAVGTLFGSSRPTIAEADAAHYKHLIGWAKRDRDYVAGAESRLQTVFPAAYARFVTGWATLDSHD